MRPDCTRESRYASKDCMLIVRSCTMEYTPTHDCVLQKEQQKAENGALAVCLCYDMRLGGRMGTSYVLETNMIICWPWQPFIKDPAVRYWLYWRDRAPQQAAAGAGTRNSVIPDKMIVAQPAKQFSARTVPQGSYETGACSFPEPNELNAPRAIYPVCLCSSFYIWVFQVVHLFRNGLCLHKFAAELMLLHVVKYILTTIFYFNLLKLSGHVMHRQFNIQQL